ncbi:MAG: long-chain-acyl-CoA synthetase [Proteobacteria bacterium]|nr:long-chain-acyl-CoA synthetase [Pseudomonadota bacterium]
MRALPRQLRSTAQAIAAQLRWDPDSNQTLALQLEQWARARAADPLLWFEGRRWSVAAVNAAVNQHAHAYHALGLRPGDVVALLFDNRPAYLFHFYALAKLGVVASLLDPQLVGAPLAQAIDACHPQLLVASGAQRAPLEAIRDAVALGSGQILVDDEAGAGAAQHAWARVLAERATSDPPQTLARRLGDVMAYVYTSGTTGLPRPAVIKHHRLWRAGMVFGAALRVAPEDCVYNCLPLCHGTAVIIAVPVALTQRCRLALGRRFSARRFWDECHASGATIFSYVGELCRYLAQQPAGPAERDHKVTRVFGNGLRAELWPTLRQRFGVRQVLEFYASTEGNAETLNLLNTPGSCGVLVPGRMALARYDLERDALVRDAKGFAVAAAPEEPALLLGAISTQHGFDGYVDPTATEQRVLTDVFARGDRWFDSGDLLRRDRLHRLYFVDRLGDSFRWQGHNVSAQQVEEVLLQAPGVKQCAVYGVAVPGAEGRAGMAALVSDAGFHGESCYEYLSRALPPSAQPRFLRLVAQLPLTGSLKPRKRELRERSFDPARLGEGESLYARDAAQQSYVPLTAELWAEINRGSWAG